MDKKLTPNEIIKRWAEIVEYDPSQTSFEMTSESYLHNRLGGEIKFINDYDPTGMVAVIYMKSLILDFYHKAQVRVLDLLSEPNALSAQQEIYNMLTSETVSDIETNLLNIIETVIASSTDTKRIGNIDASSIKDQMMSVASAVIEALQKCKLHAYFLSGKPIENISGIAKQILITKSLDELLRTLETIEDGLYVTYVGAEFTPDGWFGFFIKSNGNIISIDERKQESFPGNFRNHRNHSYLEHKADTIFPYKDVFKYSKPDYKGYATEYTLKFDEINIFDLPFETLAPMLLAAFLLANKYNGQIINEPITYSSYTMFGQSKHVAEALVKCDKTCAIEVASKNALHDIVTDFNTTSIINGDFAQEIKALQKKRNADRKAEIESSVDNAVTTLHVMSGESRFIDLYGDGFTLDHTSLLIPQRNLLTSEELKELKEPDIHNEFIGTALNMKIAAYQEARSQLANYIQYNMEKDLRLYGGTEAWQKEYNSLVKAKRDKLMRLCAKLYAYRTYTEWDDKGNMNPRLHPEDLDIPCRWNYIYKPGKLYYYKTLFANQTEKDKASNLIYPIDPFNDASCNVYITCRPSDAQEICDLLDIEMQDLPKFVQIWKLTSGYNGNSNFYATDKVHDLKSPIEDFYYDQIQGMRMDRFDPEIMIAMSKRTLNKLLKDAGLTQISKKHEYKKDE